MRSREVDVNVNGGLVREHRRAEDELWAVHGLTRTERRLWLPRLGLNVRVQEVGEGPTVLFVPALVTTGSVFVPLVPHLSGFRCVLLDRPGTGASEELSPPMTGPGLRGLGESLLLDVLDALEIHRGRVVGASLGGTLTLIAAGAQPERFDRIMLLGCPVMLPGMPATPLFRLLCTEIGRRAGMWALSHPAGFDLIARLIGHGPTVTARRVPLGVVKWVNAMARHSSTVRNDLAALGTMGGLAGADPDSLIPVDTLSSITTPTVFYSGANDPFSPRWFVNQVADSMQDAAVEVVASSGHMPWLDDPRRAGAAIAAHLHAPYHVD